MKPAGPWPTILVCAVAIPMAIWLVVTSSYDLDADGREALGTLLGLGGLALAAFMYWRS